MAAPHFYKWHRLWYPLNEPLPVESGYLKPHPGDPGLTLAAMENKPCLVLLGAPGMGKSYEAKSAEAALLARGEAVDFIEAQRRSDLGRSLLDLLGTARAEAWLKERATWHVLIDGLDELEGGTAAFDDILRRFLEAIVASGGELNALRLRLFCRTVEWAAALDEALAAVWAAENIEKRQLAPLQEADVFEAADDFLGDPEQAGHFVKEIAASHVEAIAARPVSLRMLIKLFDQHKKLPARQADLFEQGLRALFVDGDRSIHPGRTELDPRKLLITAGRIAVAMVLSGNSAVSIAADGGSAEEMQGGILPLAHLAGGLEPIPPFSFRVRQEDLLDAVRSPLFVGLGSDTFVWAHQTFKEYLAARYLIAHEIDANRVLEFLTIPDPRDGIRAVIPKLREVAAWTATLSPAVFNELLKREPDILLQSDVAAVEESTRARLVDALLVRLNTSELEDTFWFWHLRPMLNRLDHPGLIEQLRKAILEESNSLSVRTGAIDIAEENRAASLAPDLVDIARNTSTPLALRRRATGAVVLLGGPSEKRALVDLLIGNEGEALDDEMRGWVLSATWPNLLTVQQLLTALTAERNPNLIGSYASFLYRFDPGTFSTADALAALEWIEPHLTREEEDGGGREKRVLAKLFWAAAAKGSDPVVRQTLARLFNAALDRLAYFFLDSEMKPSVWPGSAEDRVALVLETLDGSEDPVLAVRYLQHIEPKLVDPADLRLYMAAFPDLKRQTVRVALAELIVSLSQTFDLDTLDDVWKLAAIDKDVGDSWTTHYSTKLDSPSVAWMRDASKREDEVKKIRAEQALRRERADSVTRELLSRSEKGEPEVWWQLNLQLFVDDAGAYKPELEFQSDLTKTPGWNRLKGDERQRVVNAADAYLLRCKLETLSWIGSRTHYRPAAAGYRALRLLHDHRPDWFGRLEPTIWRKWAAVTIGFFDNDAGAASTIQTSIVARAYKSAPRAVIGALIRLARGAQSEGITRRPLDLLDQAYDEKLGRVLDSLRGKRTRGLESNALIASFLVRHKYQPLIEEVRADLAAKATTQDASDGDTSGLVEACAELLAAADLQIWTLVLSLRTRNPDLARIIWERLSTSLGFQRRPEFAPLGEEMLAKAYLDLHYLFPQRPKETPDGRFLTAVDFVERLRDIFINHLVARGSSGALNALNEIVTALPEDVRTRSRIPEASRTFRDMAPGRDPRETLQLIALLSNNYPERSVLEEVTAKSAQPRHVEPVPTEMSAQITPEAFSGQRPSPEIGTRIFHIVALATEWRSGNGGVSTLNRELCIALAAQGHKVICLVLDATPLEIEQAGNLGVQLVRCPEPKCIAGLPRFLTLATNSLPVTPDMVLGHDQITGPYALHLAERLNCVYVHFLHTVPEEIEQFKSRTRAMKHSFYRGNEKRDAQRELCEEARLIVAIGPRIFSNAPYVEGVPTHQMIPGLNVALLARQIRKPPRVTCLIGGRMEDADIKGLPIAAPAIYKLNGERKAGERVSLVVRGFDPDGNETEMDKTSLTRDQWLSFIIPRPYTDISDKIYNDLAEASVVMMPSLAEGFGLTGFEAIAAGVPILITEQSGLAEWLIDLENQNRIPQGFCDACIEKVDPDDGPTIERWRKKLAALISDRESAFLRAGMLRDALKAEFTWENAARKFMQQYEALTDPS